MNFGNTKLILGKGGSAIGSPLDSHIILYTDNREQFRFTDDGKLKIGLKGSFITTYQDSHLIFHTNKFERLRINDQGRVGIGTKDQKAVLQITKTNNINTEESMFRVNFNESWGLKLTQHNDGNSTVVITETGKIDSLTKFSIIATNTGGHIWIYNGTNLLAKLTVLAQPANQIDNYIWIAGASLDRNVFRWSDINDLEYQGAYLKDCIEAAGGTWPSGWSYQSNWYDYDNIHTTPPGNGESAWYVRTTDQTKTVNYNTYSPGNVRYELNQRANNINYGVLHVKDGDVAIATIEEGGSLRKGKVGIGIRAPVVALHMEHTDAIKIPKGTTAERPTANATVHKGYVRYNTTLDIFEGYGAGPAWGSLGGVIDVDQDTYIVAESSAGADNDELWFYTAGKERLQIKNSGRVGIGTDNPDSKLELSGNMIIGHFLKVSGSWDSVTVIGTKPNARRNAVSVMYNNEFIIHGGNDANTTYNDVWKLNLLNNEWNQVTTNGETSPTKTGHIAIAYVKKMFIFGGEDNDVYNLNLFTNTWTKAPVTGTKPNKRYYCSGVLHNTKIYIFGGWYGQTYYNDLWEFDIAENSWELITTSGSSPSIRNGHKAEVYNGEMYVFGGYYSSNRYNDLYKYNFSTKTWSQLSPTGAIPGIRNGSTINVYGNELIIFGGRNNSNNNLSDVYSYNFIDNKWIRRIASSNINRYWTSEIFYDGAIYIFGGINELDNLENTVYKLSIKEDTSNIPSDGLIIDGNLGIGTAQPTTTLTLKRKTDNFTYGSGTQMIDFKPYMYDETNNIPFDEEVIKASIYSGIDNVTYGLNTTRGYLGFMVRGSVTTNPATNPTLREVMRIDNQGNVGIGINTPYARLDIENDGGTQEVLKLYQRNAESYGANSEAVPSNSSYSPYNPKGTLINLNSVGSSAQTNASLINFNAYGPNGGNTGVYLGNVSSGDNNGPGNLVFGRRTGATSWSESMRINKSGYVGIGTNNYVDTRSILHIKKNSGISFQADTGQTDSRNWRIRQDDYGAWGSLQISVGSNNTDFGDSSSDVVMTMLKNRNVGIGTTNPDRKVHIVGDVRIEGSLTTNGETSIINTNQNNTERLSVTNDGTGPAIIANQKGSQPIVDFQDDGTSVFYIEDGGNVGLGTTNPQYKLDIRDSGTCQLNIYGGSTGSYAEIRLSGNNNNVSDPLLYLGAGPVNSEKCVYISSRYDYPLLFLQDNSEKMRIDDNGNIGIGTKVPSQLLHIFNSSTAWNVYANIRLSADINNGNTYYGEIGYFRGTSDSTDEGLVFSGRAISRKDMIILSSNGNIGIGTTNPGEKLSVNGSIMIKGSSNSTTTNESKLIFTRDLADSDESEYIAQIYTGNYSGPLILEAARGGGYVKIISNRGTTDPIFVVSHADGYERFRINGYGYCTLKPFNNSGINNTWIDSLSNNNKLFFGDADFGIGAGKFGLDMGSNSNSECTTIWCYEGSGRGIRFCSTSDGDGHKVSQMTTRMIVHGDTGNVGIGTTNPDSNVKLQIESNHNDGARLKIKSTNSSSGWKAPVIDLCLAGGSSNLIFSHGDPNISGIWFRPALNKNIIFDFQTGTGKVGIATTDPGNFKLKIYNSTGTNTNGSNLWHNHFCVEEQTAAGAGMTFKAGTQTGYIYYGSSNGSPWIGTGSFGFATTATGNSTDVKMIITNDGKVGINNRLSTTATLDIWGPTNNPTTATMSTTSSQAVVRISGAQGQCLEIGGMDSANSYGVWMQTHNQSSTSNTQYSRNLCIQPIEGNVGIGTLSPDRGLCILDNQNTGQLIGAYSIGYNASYQEAASLKIFQHLPISSSTYRISDGGGNGDPAINIVTNYIGSGANSTSHLGGSIQFTTQTRDNPTSGGAHGQAYAAIYGGRHSGYTNYEGEMIFYTADTTNRVSGANLNPRMTIKGGNVGIGTTSPYGKLDIKHSNWTQTPSSSTMCDMLNLMVSSPSTTGQGNMRTLICFADGYRNDSATKDSYRVRCRMSGAGFDMIWNSSATETLGSNTSNNNFIFARDYTAFMNKNVGFGTTSPNYALSFGTSEKAFALYENNGNYFYGMKVKNVNGWGINFYTSSGNDADGNIRMSIKRDSGYVGVGTTSPGGKLHTVGTSGVHALRVSGNSGNNAQVYCTGSNYGIRVTSAASSGSYYSAYFEGSSGNGLYVRDDGDVGIGTTSPSTRLHVKDTTCILTLETTQGDENGRYCYIDFKDSGGSFAWFGDGSGGNKLMYMFLTDNQPFVITGSTASSTRVGIGNSNPGYMLDVTGDINFTGTLRKNGTEYGGSSGSGDWECEVEWSTGNAGGTRQVKVNGVQVNSGTNALNAIYLNKDGTYKGRSTGQYLWPGNTGAWNTEADEWNAQDNGTIIIVATSDWINAPATGGSAQTLLESIGALDAFNIPSDRVGYILAFIKGSYGCIEKLGNNSTYHNGKVFFSYYDLLNITSGQYNYSTTESPDFQLSNMHVGNLRSVGKIEVLPGSISGTAIIGKIRVGSWNYGSYDYMSIQHQSLGWSGVTGNYALRQDATGITDINCASSKSIGFLCNNEYKMYMNSSGQFSINNSSSIMVDAKLSINVPDEGTMISSPDISQFLWRINASSKWGLYWSTNGSGNNYYLHSDSNPNQFVFVGNNTARAAIDVDNGNVITTGWYHRTSHYNGGLCGSYNSVGANEAKTNPIYVIGSNYQPNETTLGNMYGIGFTSTTTFTGTQTGGGWGLYAASDGDVRWFANAGSGSTYQTSWVRVGGTNGIYFQDYGGGWHMNDTSYVRCYNNKAVMIMKDDNTNNSLVELLQLRRHADDESSSSFAEGGYISMIVSDDNSGTGETARISFRSDNAANNETSGRMGFWTQNSGTLTQRVGIDKSGNMTCTGDITAFGSLSDIKLKENITTLDTKIILNKVLQLRPVSFKWLDDLDNEKRRGKKDEGLIAQEVEEVWPMLVDEIETFEDDHKKIKYIHYNKLSVYMAGAIQEQQKQINKLKHDKETQKKEITELRNENNMLKEQMKSVLERLAALESK